MWTCYPSRQAIQKLCPALIRLLDSNKILRQVIWFFFASNNNASFIQSACDSDRDCKGKTGSGVTCMYKRPIPHKHAAVQWYEYRTLHPTCGTLLSFTEVTQIGSETNFVNVKGWKRRRSHVNSSIEIKGVHFSNFAITMTIGITRYERSLRNQYCFLTFGLNTVPETLQCHVNVIDVTGNGSKLVHANRFWHNLLLTYHVTKYSSTNGKICQHFANIHGLHVHKLLRFWYIMYKYIWRHTI